MVFKRSRWMNRLALVFTSLAALIILLFWILRGRYENHLRQQIWTAQAPAISVISNSSAPFSKSVLLLGDSRMAEWGLPQFPRWRVINAGIRGLTTSQLCLVTPELLDQFHPDVVVVQAGINDLKYLGLRPEEAPQIVALVRRNLAQVVNQCLQHQAKAILLETWPAGPPAFAHRLVWNEAIVAATLRLNQHLRLMNEPGKGVWVEDLLKDAELSMDSDVYRDTLHFKPQTYQLLNPVLLRLLNQTKPD